VGKTFGGGRVDDPITDIAGATFLGSAVIVVGPDILPTDEVPVGFEDEVPDTAPSCLKY